jgi:hypothetical protein
MPVARLIKQSTFGGCQLLGCSLVSWSSKKQNSVSLSTAEAEYICNTLKFMDFRMLLGKIIKQGFSYNFKIIPTFIFFTGNLV